MCLFDLQEIKCPVPFCSNIKQKLKQQQMQQRLQQAQLIRRRMAMTTQSVRGAMSTSGGKPATMAMVHQPQSQQPAIMGIPSHQQGIGMKPGTQGPPANVLQVVKQVKYFFGYHFSYLDSVASLLAICHVTEIIMHSLSSLYGSTKEIICNLHFCIETILSNFKN